MFEAEVLFISHDASTQMRSFENTFSPLFFRSLTLLLIVLCYGGAFGFVRPCPVRR